MKTESQNNKKKGLNIYEKRWLAAKKFHEVVWRFGDVVETITADSLRELMIEVCNKYGYE